MSALPTISVNSAVTESLSTTDIYNAANGWYEDYYMIDGLTGGQTVSVDLLSNSFDAYIEVYNLDSGELVALDDNSGSGTNSSATFTATFGDEGSYGIYVSSVGSNSTGNYTLAVTPQPAGYV